MKIMPCYAASDSARRIREGRAEHVVQPRRGDHLDDRPHAPALVADPPRRPCRRARARDTGSTGCPSLSLSRTTSNAVARRRRRAPGAPRSRSARPPACASTRNRSFIGALVNHLCPCSVYSPSLRGRRGLRSRWPARPSRPASRSCPSRRARRAWSAQRPQAGVVRRRGQQRRPLLGERVVGAQRRDRGVGHRDRAAVARLGVRPGQKPGGAAHVRVRAPSGPTGRPARPSPTARSISQCHDGWNATSSIRLP